MLRQIGKRLVTTIPSLIGVIIVTFLLTRVLPGDPAAYFAGPAATPQAIEEVRKSLGLDKSLPEQFARYVKDLTRGTDVEGIVTWDPPEGEWTIVRFGHTTTGRTNKPAIQPCDSFLGHRGFIC